MKPSTGHGGARNILSNWAGFLVATVVNFFISPFVVRHLGDTAYGSWVLICSLTGYLGLLDLGVRGAVTRYVARFHAEGSHERSGRIASAASLIFAATGMIAILASFGLALFANRLFKIPADLVDSVRLVFPLVGLNVCFALVGGVFGGTVTGLQRFDVSNAVEIFVALLRALVIVVALNFHQGIVALALIQTTSSFLTLIIYRYLSGRLYPELRLSWANLKQVDFRDVVSFSGFAFLLQISTYLVYFTDSVVIGAFLPVSQITYFAVAGNLILYSKSMISGISTATSPFASAMEGRGETDQVGRMLLNRARFASLLILPICAAFLIRGGTFLGLWMGAKFAVPSGRVLGILSLALMFAAANQIAGSTMLGIGRHKGLVPITITEGLANLGLSIILIRPLGIHGVAWGTTIPSLMSSLVLWPWYVSKVLGTSRVEYFSKIWIRPGLAILPFALATFLMEHYFQPVTLLSFFMQVVAVLPIAILGFWNLCFTPEERKFFSGKLKGASAIFS